MTTFDIANRLVVDKSLPLPLYSQLREILAALIQLGELKEGDPIPTEQELGRKFQVSRITVRRAIDELAREGYLITRQGKGTFVARPKIQRPMTRLKSFSAATADAGHRPSSRLLSLRHEKANSHVAGLLQVDKGQWIWLLERLRLVDNEPLGLSEVYLNLPADVVITPFELEPEGSLWSILDRKGVKLTHSDETIQAVLASDKQAELLQVEAASPLLLIEGVVYDDHDTAVEYHRNLNRGDRYKYSVQLIR
jgi:GntR family transcriptional regulator